MDQELNIRKITNYEANRIIRQLKPIGKFYSVTTGPGIGQKTTGNTYIGIDNSTRDAWTEEFEYEDEVLAWLSCEWLNAEEIRAGAHKTVDPKMIAKPSSRNAYQKKGKIIITIDLDEETVKVDHPERKR